jgi:hypothetical protein
VCSNGTCQACATGDRQCVDSGHYQTCSGGAWTPTAAPFPACGTDLECWGPGRCTDCTPGQKDCATSTQPRTCNTEGAWANATACSNQTCVNGTCQGVCTFNSTRCAGDGVSYERCNAAGQWEPGGQCVNQACVTGATVCSGVCTPGAVQCSGAQPQVCNSNGQWQNNGSSCGFGCRVANGATSCCSNPCTGNGGAACNKTVTNACGVSATCGATCDAGFECLNSVCSCENFPASCVDADTRRTCVSGTRYTDTTCSGNARCCECDAEALCLTNCGSPICIDTGGEEP